MLRSVVFLVRTSRSISAAVDETNTRVKVKKIIDLFRDNDGFGMVGLVGVQSNQFPHALDLARPLRQAGIPVVIGGFHVSGVLAMLPEIPPSLQEALDMGCTLFAGECEDGRIDQILQDAAIRQTQTDLQLHGRSSVARIRAHALFAAPDGSSGV